MDSSGDAEEQQVSVPALRVSGVLSAEQMGSGAGRGVPVSEMPVVLVCRRTWRSGGKKAARSEELGVMSYTIKRKDENGFWMIIGWVDDPTEIGPVIDEDRKKIDYEPEYWAGPDRD